MTPEEMEDLIRSLRDTSESLESRMALHTGILAGMDSRFSTLERRLREVLEEDVHVTVDTD